MLVCRSHKSNNTLLSSMADIDSNDHDLFLVHELWQLHSERLSSNLRVNLLHDVGSNRHVDLLGSERLDALSEDIQSREDLLHFWIVILVVQKHKTEVVSVVLAASLILQVIEVFLNSLLHSSPVLSHIWEHEGLDLSTLHTHLSLALHESFLDILSDALIFSLVEKDESFL